MITKISGTLLGLADDSATLALEPFEYQVYVAESSRRSLQQKVGERVSLFTIHYFDGDPSRGRVTPRLVGFLSEVEREFFEMFCSVDGVGAKKALRAMVRPVQDIAVFPLRIRMPGREVTTGYGTFFPDVIHDAGWFTAMLRDAGFDVVTERVTGGTFFLDARKRSAPPVSRGS